MNINMSPWKPVAKTILTMLWPFGNKQKSDIEKALLECKKANTQGYKDAKVYLEDVRLSVEKAALIIEECVDSMKKHHINDTSVIDSVKKQLEVVHTEFEKSFFQTQSDLLTKSKMSSNFNITLFGRTKSGKSTLMEILTHGDGSHMGNGGQRTTRDVRSYDWKGMSVTDVPGIDAYGGQEDDELAEKAATFADLILFMITAGQPESTEADWMVKLKRMDKPIVCICNFKQSIGTNPDDIRLKRLLNNPEKVEERMNISELNEQFNLFLKEHLPDEHVDFIITHLLAKFYSQQPEYQEYQEKLDNISKFANVEKAIIDEVLTNGVLHRKKCYLSIIDSSIYLQMNMLFKFSKEAYSQYRIIKDKITSFENWCEHFNQNQKSQIQSRITLEYDKLRNSVPGFIEAHLEDSDLTQSWSRHCERLRTNEGIEKIIDSIKSKFKAKVKEVFSELKNEMNFNDTFNKNSPLGDFKITNWKRIWKWTGQVGGVGFTIAATIFSFNPIGWILGIGAIFGLFSWFSDSRDKKLRECRKELSEELNKNIDNNERKSIRNAIKWFDENVIPQQREVISKLWLITKSMLSLANGERELALGYSNNHIDITKRIVSNVLRVMNVPEKEIKRIIFAARVPGRRLTLVIEGYENLPFTTTDLYNRMGHEYVHIIKLNRSRPIRSQLRYLLTRLNVCEQPEPTVVKVDDGKQTIAYLHNDGFNQEQLDSIDIIQQLLNIHINLY